jgi:hypothetical protein
MLDCIRSPTASDVRLLQTTDRFRRLTASDARLLQTPDCFRRPTASDDRLLQAPDCFRRPTASDSHLLQKPDCFRLPTASDARLLQTRLLQTTDCCGSGAVKKAAVQRLWLVSAAAAGTCRQTRLPPSSRGSRGRPLHPRLLPWRQQQWIKV